MCQDMYVSSLFQICMCQFFFRYVCVKFFSSPSPFSRSRCTHMHCTHTYLTDMMYEYRYSCHQLLLVFWFLVVPELKFFTARTRSKITHMHFTHTYLTNMMYEYRYSCNDVTHTYQDNPTVDTHSYRFQFRSSLLVCTNKSTVTQASSNSTDGYTIRQLCSSNAVNATYVRPR